MTAPTSRFWVGFVATSCYKVTLDARSEKEAIAKARRLWDTKGEEPFTCWAGDTDGWEAFPD